MNRVIPTIKMFSLYYLITTFILSMLILIFSKYIGRLFFSDPTTVLYLSNSIRIYSISLVFEGAIPSFLTLLRIFDMNSLTIYINFGCFGIPLLIWMYFATFVLKLEYYGPFFGILIGAFILCFVSTIILYKKIPHKMKNMEKDNELVSDFTSSHNKKDTVPLIN